MPNAQVVWPASVDPAEPEGYRTYINANSPWAALTPPQLFAGPVAFDFYGQPYLPYLGPPLVFGGNVIAEPEDGPAHRPNSVIVYGGVRLPDEE